MMGRYASGHGHGMGGSSKHSRQSAMATDMLSTMEKAIVAREEKKNLARGVRADKPAARGGAPAPYPGVINAVAHTGMNGAPTIYTEKFGGRRGMRGKRGA